MCEIFAAMLKKSRPLNDYLKEFYSHSEQHPHGWGLVQVSYDGVEILKEPLKASESHFLKQRLSVPVEGGLVLAHIRYATIGNIKYENCHPFLKRDASGRKWILIHNGTIFDAPELSRYQSKQQGDTDSERVLLYIIDRVNELAKTLGREPDKDERFALIDSLIKELSKGNKLNILLYDSEQLYVHSNYRSSVHVLEKEDGVIISTKPLQNESFSPVELNTVFVYEDGVRTHVGTAHENEYFDDAENMKYLYQIFAEL